MPVSVYTVFCIVKTFYGQSMDAAFPTHAHEEQHALQPAPACKVVHSGWCEAPYSVGFRAPAVRGEEDASTTFYCCTNAAMWNLVRAEALSSTSHLVTDEDGKFIAIRSRYGCQGVPYVAVPDTLEKSFHAVLDGVPIRDVDTFNTLCAAAGPNGLPWHIRCTVHKGWVYCRQLTRAARQAAQAVHLFPAEYVNDCGQHTWEALDDVAGWGAVAGINIAAATALLKLCTWSEAGLRHITIVDEPESQTVHPFYLARSDDESRVSVPAGAVVPFLTPGHVPYKGGTVQRFVSQMDARALLEAHASACGIAQVELDTFDEDTGAVLTDVYDDVGVIPAWVMRCIMPDSADGVSGCTLCSLPLVCLPGLGKIKGVLLARQPIGVVRFIGTVMRRNVWRMYQYLAPCDKPYVVNGTLYCLPNALNRFICSLHDVEDSGLGGLRPVQADQMNAWNPPLYCGCTATTGLQGHRPTLHVATSS